MSNAPLFVEDSKFTIQHTGDLSAQVQFDNSDISTSTLRTQTFQDKDCTLACLDDISNGTAFVTSGSWSPTFSNQAGFTGTPSATSARYIRVDDNVSGAITISGLSNPTGGGSIDFDLPVARTSGDFSSASEGSGVTNAAALLGGEIRCITTAKTGTETLEVASFSGGATGGCLITIFFEYDAS